jgi:hypothetical protein
MINEIMSMILSSVKNQLEIKYQNFWKLNILNMLCYYLLILLNGGLGNTTFIGCRIAG